MCAAVQGNQILPVQTMHARSGAIPPLTAQTMIQQQPTAAQIPELAMQGAITSKSRCPHAIRIPNVTMEFRKPRITASGRAPQTQGAETSIAILHVQPTPTAMTEMIPQQMCVPGKEDAPLPATTSKPAAMELLKKGKLPAPALQMRVYVAELQAPPARNSHA